MKQYNHKLIEKKWREKWRKSGLYKTEENFKKPKKYILDMFPFPSGEGLHVGHPKGYIATDIYSRFKKMSGYNILHPMGWDAFGLPAENYALERKIHPKAAVDKNIKRFKEQLSLLGFNYDWSREVNTTDPDYYKWTQWIFLKLFEKGLAYESDEPINWCPSCRTGLSNEDLEGNSCERCGSVVEKKPLRQWMLKITAYAERLLTDLEKLDWPESIKESQRNWIGKSQGIEIKFSIFPPAVAKRQLWRAGNSQFLINVFTTRPDTLFGATYCVLAPDHELVKKLKPRIKNWQEVEKYIEKATAKSEIERTTENKEKTGAELKGIKVINPANSEELPVFVADYVLAHYGTGAIMAVPAHDQRDFEFAKKFNLPIKQVICQFYPKPVCPVLDEAYLGEGKLVQSGKFNGMDSEKAKKEITKFVGGKISVKYKLRDWVFSRQRYWGEPIPIIHCGKCGAVAAPESDLPVKLPEVKHYEPTGTGESPLANIKNWVKTKCPKCGQEGKRETNTMPQWAGSSWYYLRYIDPKNGRAPVDKKKEKYWSPVDLYAGGAEHATRHLIYARFWHKFLYDLGTVNYQEPFTRLQNVGLIIAEDGRKMSKRYGNVVNPDDIAADYGADTLRIYEMFMGPFDQTVNWKTESIIGARRFLERIWRLAERIGKQRSRIPSIQDEARSIKLSGKNNGIERLIHQTVKKVGDDIEGFKFNTAIAQMMILANGMEKSETISRNIFETFLKILAPFAPHLTEELWEKLGRKTSIHSEKWPEYDPKMVKEKTFELVIQINGKVRARMEAPAEASEDELRELALNHSAVKEKLAGRPPKKIIVVPGRLVNMVV